LAFVFSLFLQAHAEGIRDINPVEVLESVHTVDIYKFQSVSAQFHGSQEQLATNLVAVLNGAKSRNFSKCAAAYYLGELHFTDAVETLNSSIVLRLDENQIPIFSLVKIDPSLINPSVEALVKIGNPSIPAVIRNLAESDDAKVRELSLKVLYRIDGDKDIVQLRLQKAIAAQKDSNKKARLQVALKALADSSFEK